MVTGGTRGIGRATALAMADAGADVLFSYQRSQEAADEVVQLIREKGVRGQGYQANVSSAAEVQNMVKEATEKFGPITILVNNAGITRDKSFLKMTREMWDEVLRVNLDSLFVVTQAVLPALLGAGWGRIINVSSEIGRASCRERV